MIPFFTAATDPKWWPAGFRAAIGASVVNDLHRVAVAAVIEIAQHRTGLPILGHTMSHTNIHEANVPALAEWLMELAIDRRSAIVREVPYLFTSGAHRARAIATALSRTIHRPILRLGDNGAAVGMIAWLLSGDLPELRHVDLFEPDRRFRAPLDDLWQRQRQGLTYSVAQVKSEDAEYAAGTDLVMFCQSLFHIKPAQRAAVLERAWKALPSGGVLLVNEALRDESTPNPSRPDLVHRDELIAIMPGHPRVFREQTGWRTAENLRAVVAAEVGYSGIILSVRE